MNIDIFFCTSTFWSNAEALRTINLSRKPYIVSLSHTFANYEKSRSNEAYLASVLPNGAIYPFMKPADYSTTVYYILSYRPLLVIQSKSTKLGVVYFRKYCFIVYHSSQLTKNTQDTIS